jgi:hypothetical protein
VVPDVGTLRPHPELIASADPVLRGASAITKLDCAELSVPARQVAVFVADLLS